MFQNGETQSKHHITEDSGDAGSPVDITVDEDVTPVLTVLETPSEERPLLREARNVRNTQVSLYLSSLYNALLQGVSSWGCSWQKASLFPYLYTIHVSKPRTPTLSLGYCSLFPSEDMGGLPLPVTPGALL